jgi:TP901 family phage tail tape measure protein
MAKLRAAAEEAGSSTVFTAAQAAQGLEILSKAGLSASDAIATLPQVLAVAQGQSLEMATAAQLVTDAVGIMGLSFQESGRAADVLAKGANLSNTSIEQLGHALRVAGPLAKAAGLEIEDVVGILDALATAGLRGEQAGTGLRNVLGQLADPASKARRALAELGINTGDLTKVLDGLRGAGAGAERAILAFGIEAGPTVRNLVEKIRKRYPDGIEDD